MSISNILKGSLVATLLVVMAAGDALAQGRGRGGRGEDRGARAASDGARAQARSRGDRGRGPSRPAARAPDRGRAAATRAPDRGRAAATRAPQRPQVQRPQVQSQQPQRPQVQRPQIERGLRDAQARRAAEDRMRDFRAQLGRQREQVRRPDTPGITQRPDVGRPQFDRDVRERFRPEVTRRLGDRRPDIRPDVRERFRPEVARRPDELRRPDVDRRDLRERFRPDVARRPDELRRPGVDVRERIRPEVDPRVRERFRPDVAFRPDAVRRPDLRRPQVAPELREEARRQRDLVERAERRWRQAAWRGERGEGRDHRDWTGRWREGDRFVAAERIRDRWKRDRDFDRIPFHSRWWERDRHRHHSRFWLRHARLHHPFFWWSWVTAPRLHTWIGWHWPQYYYWDYGPGEYIYYWDGVIYVNNRWYAPAPLYYEQTVRLVEEVPTLTEERIAAMEWMPLGVFAVTRDGVAEVDVMVQLAITPDGVIGGTVFDQRTSESFDVEGIVDRDSQRTVWSWVDAADQRIIMETSLYNLTQPSATGMAHFAPDDMQVIHLVRLESPDEDVAVELPPGLEAELPPPQ